MRSEVEVKDATAKARKGNWGGSASGGGYDYQAEVGALIASKILSGQSLNWLEAECDQVPLSVAMETGRGGDDLAITLRSGATVEVQAKGGLRKGSKLWDALIRISQRLETKPGDYGVIITTSSASQTVRVHLRQDIDRVGQGRHDDLHSIGREMLEHLKEAGVAESSVCSRMRIVVRDLDPGSQGEEETLSTLREVIADSRLAHAARNTLTADALDMITRRGRRDATSLVRALKKAGISVSKSTQNNAVLREAYMDWCVGTNDHIMIPTLGMTLPMCKAWIRLRSTSPTSDKPGTVSLAEQMRHYHEWYQLRRTGVDSQETDIASAAARHHLLVVIGGPGAGKSTLLRRLARDWSASGRLVLRAPLRAVAARMRNGETFDEAVLASAAEGFSLGNDAVMRMLGCAATLLADGLDETGTDRAMIADCIRKWALAGRERHVVVTTRPVGHQPAWFEGWHLLELAPLRSKDVEAFAENVFQVLHKEDPSVADNERKRFVSDVHESETASVASRSPQLLGFLIALHLNGHDISGGRFHLFQSMLELIRRHEPRDRVLQHQADPSIARHVAQCLGWLLLNDPVLPTNEAVEKVGVELATELLEPLLRTRQLASRTISFWEERGLLEELSAGATTLLTFVHMGFTEFAAAGYLEHMPEAEFAEWIRANRTIPMYRDAIVLTGATERAALTTRLILEADDPHDPGNAAGLMAADVLSEALAPPDQLIGKVAASLLARVNSPVPMVAYEAGERLRLLASIRPGVVGPAVHDLSTNDQPWTSEIACALALICGPECIDTQVLADALRTASRPPDRQGYHRRRAFGTRSITQDLLLKGMAHLLREGAAATHPDDLIRQVYTAGGLSLDSYIALRPMVVDVLGEEEVTALDKEFHKWLTTDFTKCFAADGDRIRKAQEALLEALIKAAKELEGEGVADSSPRLGSCLWTLWQVLEVYESPMDDVYTLMERPSDKALVEVFRGAILVSALDPRQVTVETQTALDRTRRPEYRWHELLLESERAGSEVEINWSLARKDRLRLDPLLLAVRHPSCIVWWFAVLLLVHCVDRSAASDGLAQALMDVSGDALGAIAQFASEVWGSDASGVLLERLEKDLTDDCYPLVYVLGTVCDQRTVDRAERVLRDALESNSPNLVMAAVHSIQELRLHDGIEILVKARYQWWLQHTPPDTVHGPFTTKWRSPTTALFSLLAAQGVLSVEEIWEAAEAQQRDVHQLAIPLLCQKLAEDDELLQRALHDVASDDLAIDVIGELSKSHPEACSRNCDSILELLDSKNPRARAACATALGNGWALHGVADRTLRALLNDADTGIRNVATRALRELARRRSGSPRHDQESPVPKTK